MTPYIPNKSCAVHAIMKQGYVGPIAPIQGLHMDPANDLGPVLAKHRISKIQQEPATIKRARYPTSTWPCRLSQRCVQPDDWPFVQHLGVFLFHPIRLPSIHSVLNPRYSVLQCFSTGVHTMRLQTLCNLIASLGTQPPVPTSTESHHLITSPPRHNQLIQFHPTTLWVTSTMSDSVHILQANILQANYHLVTTFFIWMTTRSPHASNCGWRLFILKTDATQLFKTRRQVK